MLGIIGIFLGLVCLCYFAYTGWSALATTMSAAIVVMLFNGINVWTGLSEMYAAALGKVFTAYFLLFFFSGIYGAMMSETGACTTIANFFLRIFGEKRIIGVLVIVSFLLCYGGIAMFTIWFAIGPIMWSTFKKLNIPNVMATCILGAGVGSLVLIAPGSPQIQNVIPTQYLGSSLYGSAALGFPMLIIGMVLEVIYAERVYKKLKAKVEAGEMGFDESKIQTIPERPLEECPKVFPALLPMIAVIGIVLGFTLAKSETLTGNKLAIIAMIIGTLVNVIVNWKFWSANRLKKVQNAIVNSTTKSSAIALSLGGISGFGAIMSNTAGYKAITAKLVGMKASPYLKIVIPIMCIAFMCGSSSGSMNIVLPQLGEYFISTGISPNVIHTLTAFSAVTIDAMPWTTGAFTIFVLTGVTHKEGYKYIFICDVLIPLIVVVLAVLFCMITKFGMA